MLLPKKEHRTPAQAGEAERSLGSRRPLVGDDHVAAGLALDLGGDVGAEQLAQQ
jgi:hypothetical protein